MGERDHRPAVDHLRPGHRLTIVRGAVKRLRLGGSRAEKIVRPRRLGAIPRRLSASSSYGAAVVTLGVLANVDVDDLERATEFYCSDLGLRVGRRFEASAVELVGGSSPMYLLTKASGTVASSAFGGTPRLRSALDARSSGLCRAGHIGRAGSSSGRWCEPRG
jgi:hypothetical protein